MKKFFGIGSINKKAVIKRLLSVKFIVSLAVVIAVTTLGIYGYITYNKADKVAQRVFWGAVNQNLQTSSFTNYSFQKSGGQSAEETVNVFTSPKQGTHSQTHFVQTGVDEAQAFTENIGTPYSDYVRYVSIETTQKNAEGKSYDFSNILNVWGASAADKSQTNGQLYGQSVLAAMPIGNLTAAQRHTLIQMMKDKHVYQIGTPKVTHAGLFRRPSYAYTVTLDPAAYVTVLKQFGEYVGLTQLKSLTPSDYAKSPKSTFQVTIDGWSREVTHIVEPGASKSEAVNGYNVRKAMTAAPTNTVSIDELQNRLQSIQ